MGISVVCKAPSAHILLPISEHHCFSSAAHRNPAPKASLFNVGLPIVRAPGGACAHKLVAAALVALPQQVHKPVRMSPHLISLPPTAACGMHIQCANMI